MYRASLTSLTSASLPLSSALACVDSNAVSLGAARFDLVVVSYNISTFVDDVVVVAAVVVTTSTGRYEASAAPPKGKHKQTTRE